MLIRRSADAVRARAPAKVNLFLEVLARRPDGFHELATLMTAVSLFDTLVFREEPGGDIHLRCDLPSLSPGPDNLVTRAARLLQTRTGHVGGAAIELRKRIPLAAGLAGGSSDAAAALAGLNRLWRLGLTRAELAALGAELGSDVAFFFATPAAWCTGRGEKVEPLHLGQPLDLVLAKPSAGLSTAEVFRNVVVPSEVTSGEALRRAVEAGDVDEVGRRLFNRLTEPARRLCPEVEALYRVLGELNPVGRLMSGSGTAVFALGRDRAEAVRIARGVRQARETPAGTQVFVVRSCI